MLSEIVLGELDLGTVNDCDSGTSNCAPPVQRRSPAKVITHEQWDKEKFTLGFDIALVRMDKPVVTYLVSQHMSVSSLSIS